MVTPGAGHPPLPPSDAINAVSKLVQLKRITDGAWGLRPQAPKTMKIWGRSPPPLGDFL